MRIGLFKIGQGLYCVAAITRYGLAVFLLPRTCCGDTLKENDTQRCWIDAATSSKRKFSCWGKLYC